MPVPAGALRFNSDSGKLEYYNGEAWWQIDNFSADNATGGARGVFGAGFDGSSSTNVIQYINISSTGNAIDFGDLLLPNSTPGACASNTRGLFAGGYSTPGGFTNTIQFITIATTGNAQDFSDLTVARREPSGCSSSTRGIFAGGRISPSTYTNTIDYITSW